MQTFGPAAFLGCLVAAFAFGQQPTFDAASVKVVKVGNDAVFGNRGGLDTADPGRIHLGAVGMFSLLMRAYDVDLDRLMGPSWIMDNVGPNLYQLDATMPPGTTKEQFQLMMQNLLKERFHLAVHRESRTFPGYELRVADGGPKLKESKPHPGAAVPDTSLQTPKRNADGLLVLPPGPQMITSLGGGAIVVQAQEKPISELVKIMGRMIAQSLGEDTSDFMSRKPRVIDRTGLTGTYDFTLAFSCEACQFAVTNGALAAIPGASDPGGLPNIFAALQRQLGLKLVKVNDIPLDVIVVDHVEKTPTSN